MGDPVQVTLGEMVDLLGRDTVVSADGHAGPVMLGFSDGKGCPFEEWASNDTRLDSTRAVLQVQIDAVEHAKEWLNRVVFADRAHDRSGVAAVNDVLDAARIRLLMDLAETTETASALAGPGDVRLVVSDEGVGVEVEGRPEGRMHVGSTWSLLVGNSVIVVTYEGATGGVPPRRTFPQGGSRIT